MEGWACLTCYCMLSHIDYFQVVNYNNLIILANYGLPQSDACFYFKYKVIYVREVTEKLIDLKLIAGFDLRKRYS